MLAVNKALPLLRSLLSAAALVWLAGGPANAQPNIDCQSVAANAERSKADMAIAATMYFHNRIMGKSCGGVDYERAFDLAERSGMGTNAFLDILRARADEGFPNAIAALRRLGY